MLAQLSGRAPLISRYLRCNLPAPIAPSTFFPQACRGRSATSWCQQGLRNSQPRAVGVRQLHSTVASCGRSVARFGGRAGLFGGSVLLGAGLAGWNYTVAKPVTVQCEEAVATKAVGAGVDARIMGRPKQNIFRSTLELLGSLAALSLLVSIWAAAITMPFILVGAVVTAKWKLASALTVCFALPHVVPIPRLGLLRRTIFGGIKRWLGSEQMVRVLDFSRVSGEPEPEPEPRSASKKQLVCFHPHGIYSLGLLTVLEARPDIRVLSSPFLYHFAPAFRLAADLLLGIKMGSVGRADLARAMKKGDGPLIMVPGGFHEATITCPGHERVFLKKRMGFVKYALRYGYDLVPCYTIGEHDLMSNPQRGWKWRFALNDLSIPAVLPWGHWLFPLCPRRGVELVTAIGAPMKMPHIPNPTDADVKEHHVRYMAALQELYDRANVGTASEGRRLEMW